jgi:NitT/TauT family transport system substrate-binding protein
VPVAQMVAAGQADFGTIGGDELLLARARGADLVAVFATFQTFPQGIMVHGARHMTRIDQVFSLPGTLAMEPGVPYAVFLKSRFASGVAGAVKMVPYDGGVARFLADPTFSQQCFVTSEPIAARKQGADPQVFLIADAGYNPYATVVVTRRKVIADNPERVAAFVAASREGWLQYLDNPGAVDALLARMNPSLDTATMSEAAAAQKALILAPQAPRDSLGKMSRERWETIGHTLHELKLLEAEPPIDPAFVDEAALGNAAAAAKVKP